MGNKKRLKEILKSRLSKPTKKAKKNNRKFFDKLEKNICRNNVAEYFKTPKEKIAAARESYWNFQKFLEIIKDSETEFDNSVLKKQIDSITVNQIVITFKDKIDPYEFMSSPDMYLRKIKSVSIKPNIVTTDDEDTANEVEYEDPWPEWEPKENK